MYDHKAIEKKWQERWDKEGIYSAKENPAKPKKYILVEFPYPSGEGLHMGHLRPFVAGDTYSRYFRMKGFETMYPMGWDAFGLPAENYAIKKGVHPRVSTAKNIENAKRQLKSWGTSFDWSREVNTTDPEYYKWTQWIFLQFFKAGLAYEATGLINWCPKDKTGLANEEVIDGKCERCGAIVEKKELRQWYLKITDYAEKLLDGLKDLDWPEKVRVQQENWIGKSEGASIKFNLSDVPGQEDGKHFVEVFTTRPDTIFGATFIVVSPELAKKWIDAGWQAPVEVIDYINSALAKEEQARVAEGKDKTGVDAGIRAVNPASGEKVPVWVADYVLGGYGTGAIMAVPAHDERDFEFAKKFNLPVKQVIAPETGIRRENEILVKGGCAVVFDPKAQKYAALKHETGFLRLCSGNVNDGEDEKQGILREVNEESGLHDFGHIEKIATAYPHFHNSLKKSNRAGWASCYLVILNSADTKDTALEEHEKFSLVWVSASELTANWQSFNQEKDVDHWLLFFNQAVGRAIELGYDKTSDPGVYKQRAISEPGLLFDSGEYSGKRSDEVMSEMAKDYGQPKVQYKLRDWVFSRQRYWGEPIPLVHCDKCGVVAVPDDKLPVELPEVDKYEPTGTGESPLAAIEEWVNTVCPNCQGRARRETNTMPQWAGSSWYWLRYTDPKNNKEFAAKDNLKYWTPVDVYFGGMEHTTLHLLYSRFWNLFLYDQGFATVKEPYRLRVPHGIVLASDGEKMSKSRGNVVNPDEIVELHGADTLRMYEMFLGPHEMTVSWNDKGVVGVKRFLDKVYKIGTNFKEGEPNNSIHKLIKKISEDIEAYKFNTAIAAFMEFMNESKSFSKGDWESFLKLLSPFAPHITEELWAALGHKQSIHLERWPEYDPTLAKDQVVVIAVQVLGRTRSTLKLAAESSQETVRQAAMEDSNVKKYLEGKTVIKEIFVPNKLINFVIK
jgi:leucyl-tRNA synthetase